MDKKYIASPLNYIGGKYKLLPQILPLFPREINTFVDLFCGGCNVGINVSANRIIFNDKNNFLIDLYKAFKETPTEKILSHIKNRIQEFNLSMINKEGYLELRKLYNTKRNTLDLFVLIAYSFNHQIRFNSSGEFNIAFGKERSCYNPRMEKNLLSFLHEIKTKNVEFYSKDFDTFNLSNLEDSDFVYADPPYLITTATYNDGKRGFTGWNESTEKRLLEILYILSQRGIKFALSNVIEHKGKSNTILKSWIEQNNYITNYLKNDYSNCNYHSLDKTKNSSIEILVTNF